MKIIIEFLMVGFLIGVPLGALLLAFFSVYQYCADVQDAENQYYKNP